MTRHLEESERAMQERVQRLEASRLSLEEVSTRLLWVSGPALPRYPSCGRRASGPVHQGGGDVGSLSLVSRVSGGWWEDAPWPSSWLGPAGMPSGSLSPCRS